MQSLVTVRGEMAMSEIARLFNVEMDAVRCPFPIYHQLQEAAPVQFVEDVGCIVVTGYDKVVTVLQDSQTFASKDVTGAGALMRRRLDECELYITVQENARWRNLFLEWECLTVQW